MQDGDVRSVLDDFDPYIDEMERAELGESRVLVKPELYMPVHPSRDWIKCFVTSTQQDGFRMYLEGNARRFLLSAKSFDVGKYYISPYEGFPNIDTKPKCGYVARVERQRDSSFIVSLDYCHLCDQKLGQFCCGRSKTEREVIARVSHTVRRYRKVNMEFRCITVTIPTISRSGTRKVWCPRSFRKVNPSLPNSADVVEALSCTPKMGMRLVSKLPEWNEEANNLVVRFQGSGRILVASAKNFLLYEEKKSGPDLAELSMSHLDDSPAANSRRDRARTTSTNPVERSASEATDVDDMEGGHSDSRPSPSKAKSPQVATLDIKNMQKLSRANRSGSSTNLVEGDAGDEASRSSKNSRSSSRRERSVRTATTDHTSKETADTTETKKERVRAKDRDANSDAGSVRSGTRVKTKKSSSSRRSGDADSAASNSPKGSPRAPTSTSSTPRPAGTSSTPRKSPRSPREAGESSVLQFGKSTATRFVLDFKYPLSPLQAFGIAISAFASDEVNDSNHEVNHMNSPVIMSRKQMEYSRNRSASLASGSHQPPFAYSPLKSPFPTHS